MSRLVTYTASILNIRIIDEQRRNYISLLSKLAALKVGVVVRSDTALALTYFNSDERRGNISKYTEIDLDGPWFNEETFDEAADEDTDKISIPEHLKPNLAKFPFKFNLDEHLLSFLTVAPNSRRLSPRQLLKFFENIVLRDSIVSEFGDIEITLVQDASNIEKFFTGGPLKSLEVIIKRPNDGLDDKMRSTLGNRLRINNAQELREKLVAARGQALTPSKRTKALAKVASTIGEVKAKKEINGVVKEISSKEFVESESEKFDSRIGDTNALETLSNGLESKVIKLRDSAAADLED